MGRNARRPAVTEHLLCVRHALGTFPYSPFYVVTMQRSSIESVPVLTEEAQRR